MDSSPLSRQGGPRTGFKRRDPRRAAALGILQNVWFPVSQTRGRGDPLQGDVCPSFSSFKFLSHATKVMLKSLQARLQQYVNCELPDVQAGFRKGRRTRDQIANIHWIIKKQESSRKTSISALLTMPKPLTVWITINCENCERDGNTRPLDLPLEKSVCRS